MFESREELLRAVEEERELNEEINIDLHFIPRKLKVSKIELFMDVSANNQL